VVVFDFLPQLLCLLQNSSLMIHVVLDFQDPLKPYKSCNGLLGKALSGSVYQKAYSRLITDPSCLQLVPIIQWIDCTTVTGNDRFSLKPYMFTAAILQKCFGIPFKLGATMDICQKVKHQLHKTKPNCRVTTFRTIMPNYVKCCTVSQPPSHACTGFQWVQLVSLLWILFLASCM
jgi:hypothetical protein